MAKEHKLPKPASVKDILGSDWRSNHMRPDYVTDEHLVYLDKLRESEVTNMFSAASYVCAKFKVTPDVGRSILGYWMESFGEEDR